MEYKDCFCDENSLGKLYIVYPSGNNITGNLVIFAEDNKKLCELLIPYEKRYPSNEFEFEIVSSVSMSPKLLNTIILDTLKEIKMAKKERVTFNTNFQTFSGIVISKFNFSRDIQKPDWYIEFQDDKAGYRYIKQQIDGLSNVEFIFTEED